jgi:hypothetical protein
VDTRRIAIELARAVVLEVAPDELESFDANADRALDAIRGGGGSDEMLGFGLETLLPAATSAALGIAVFSTQKLMDHTTKGIADRALTAASAWLSRLFRRGTSRARRLTNAPLTSDQLVRIRDRARRAAIACGVAPAKAALLADSLVGQLAVA